MHNIGQNFTLPFITKLRVFLFHITDLLLLSSNFPFSTTCVVFIFSVDVICLNLLLFAPVALYRSFLKRCTLTNKAVGTI